MANENLKYFVHEDSRNWRDFSGNDVLYKADQCRFKLLVREDITKDLFFGIFALSPGEIHELHYHTVEAEFYYVIKGQGIFTVDDGEVCEELECGPGWGIYLPVNAKHKVVCTGNEELLVAWSYDKVRSYDNLVWCNPDMAEAFKEMGNKGKRLPWQKE